MSMELPYRPGVGIILRNADGRIFVARRIDMTSEAWQMPQGGIDEGEDPLTCAQRELLEETGTDKVQFIAQSKNWYTYDLPEDLIPKVWDGKYRGQRQKWFVMQFTGTDSDINIETEEPEFCEWRWAKPLELPELIVPFKQQLYTQLLDEFSIHLLSKE